MILASLAGLGCSVPAFAQEAPQSLVLNAAELFSYADAARDSGDFATAEAAYRALSANPDLEVRTEARFRLGLMLADRRSRPRDAAIEFRRILDEKPDATRVRLELARMDAALGNLGAAERELRAVQASGQLPPEVEQAVRFYANALSANKPLGGSLEVALAPDTNINRATRSDTLGTVIGDFTLSEDAKARSGLGVSVRGQAYLRAPLAKGARLLARVSTSGDIYGNSDFNDIALAVQGGPEIQSGRDRLSLSGGPVWRWYGMKPYSLSWGLSANWQHPLGRRGQLRLDGGVSHVDNRRNDFQDGELYSVSAGIDRAFSARFGGGWQVNASRTDAADPGYSDVTAGTSAYLFREFGQTTAVVSLGYSRLEADKRLFLYPRRRVDNRMTASAGLTLRRFRVGSFAPFVRLRFERNRSTVGIYDFNRVAGEFGLASAF
jgi:hypothetical protein